MSARCPCCGQEVARDLSMAEALSMVDVTAHQRRILDVLRQSFGRDIPTSRIIDYVYAEDADGGPDSANSSVMVIIHRLRKKLQPLGLTIKGRGGRSFGSGQMRLCFIEAAA